MDVLKDNRSQTLEKISLIFGHIIDSFFLPSFAFFMYSTVTAFFYFGKNEDATLFLYFLFGIGYAARPLGGFLFGYIGDKYGPRKSLILSTVLAASATFFIGILPTNPKYLILSQMGLFICRFLQGVGSGNNISLLSVYYKNNTSYNQAFINGMTLSLGLTGLILAKILSVSGNYDCISLWRTPFLITGFFGYIAVILRYLFIHKTPAPIKFVKFNITKFYTEYTAPSLLTILSSGMFLMPLYISIFGLNAYVKVSNIEEFKLINTMAVIVFMMVSILIEGIFFERLKLERYKNLIIGAHILIPFLFLEKTILHNPYYVYSLQILFLSANTFFLLYYFSYIPSLFPRTIRYRAVGFNYSIGYAFIGGFCLMGFQYLNELSDSYNFSSIFIAIAACLIFLLEKKQKTYKE